MLQQTRVEAVIVKWCRFMYNYPNVTSLANANISDLNSIWAGLGYYRRLKLLHNAAQIVVDKYNGVIPNTIQELRTLPGIGKYTAHAIASIAYQQNVPVVDGNVCRVLSRLRIVAQTIKAPLFKDQYGWELAQQIVTAHSSTTNTKTNTNLTIDQPDAPLSITTTTNVLNPGDINQALMELGATYCSPTGSGIHPNDPLKDFYWSTKLGVELATLCNKDPDDDNDYHTFDHVLSTIKNTSHCKLCASNGVYDTVTQFCKNYKSEIIKLYPNDSNDDNNKHYYETVKQLGHSLFPLPPVKVQKKEDLLVVAVICRSIPDANGINQKQWLLLKRPDTGGLLSGQWEFPTICVWRSEGDNDKSTKSRIRNTPRPDMSNHVPTIPISQRLKHVHRLLHNIFVPDDIVKALNFQSVTDEPLHHIFSHVRHTMYIEYAIVDFDSTLSISDSNNNEIPLNDTKTTSATIQQKWMTRTDMDGIGITSGVKKILDTIDKFTTSKQTISNCVDPLISTSQLKQQSKKNR